LLLTRKGSPGGKTGPCGLLQQRQINSHHLSRLGIGAFFQGFFCPIPKVGYWFRRLRW
jgi:hypothetical protein